MENELKALYTLKGELTTKIEIVSAQLRSVNEQIVAIINKPAETNGKIEAEEHISLNE